MVYPDQERVSGPRISIRKLPNEAGIHNDPVICMVEWMPWCGQILVTLFLCTL